MKRVFLISTVLLASLSFQACQTADKKSSTTKDSVSGDTTMVNGVHVAGSESTQSGLDEAGATFLRKAAIGGMMEVEASRVAQKNSKNEEVKAFATKMLEDHSKANLELKGLADSKKVIVPNALPAEDQMHVDAMKKLTGTAFDKHYIGMMVNDHDKTVDLFKEGGRNRDADLKGWATKTLTVIQQHDEQAKKIALSLK